MGDINSPWIGFYLMGVFLNIVFFIFSYDSDGLAKDLCSNIFLKVLGYISTFLYIPLIISFYSLLKRKNQ